MTLCRCLILGCLLILDFALGQADAASSLQSIRRRGVLVVGTKTDYAPFGMRDKDGRIVGIEADLAADIARRLHVKLRLVPVTSENRIETLRNGKIDLMLATFSVTPEREKQVGIITPHYYASGVAVLTAPSSQIGDERDLRGKGICAVEGAFYNKQVEEDFTGQPLVLSKNVLDSETALQAGRCAGFVYDEALLIYKKKAEQERWKGFDVVTLNEIDPKPWGLAIPIQDKNSRLDRVLSNIVGEWMRSKFLLNLEAKWIGQNTAWLRAVHIRMLSQPG